MTVMLVHFVWTLAVCSLMTANAQLYLGSKEKLTYSNALSRCEAFGGQLATFSSEGEFQALLAVRNALGSTSWFGLNDLATENSWEFVDGDTDYCQAAGANNVDCDDIPQWAVGEPNNAGSGEDCGCLYSATINDAGCSTSKSFICEFDDSEYAVETEGGAVYVARGDDKVNYATAKNRCKDFGAGGQLATFDDVSQFNAMLTVRNEIKATSWVGLDDIGEEHMWQFVDGDLSYCKPQGPGGDDCDDIPQWAPGEPNNWSGDEDCAVLYSSTLNDASCSDLRPYVCEFDSAIVKFTTDIPNVDERDDCNCAAASYFVFEVTGVQGTGTLLLFCAMSVCIVCLAYLACQNHQTAYSKGYGKVVMETESEL